MSELKPCPFCGAPAKITPCDVEWSQVCCDACDANPVITDRSRADAIRAWNTRHNDVPTLADVVRDMQLILARNAATDGGGTYNDLLHWCIANAPQEATE